MPKRTDIKSVLIIGAGPIIIGQACEFDYSGTQGIKALKEEGFRVILINSNPATIMTDKNLADAVYIEPITTDFIEKVIAKERPCAILPTLGGQTALNATLQLHKSGILDKYKVELIGATPQAIEKAEDRGLFKEIVEKIQVQTYKDGCYVFENLACPKSVVVNTFEDAVKNLDFVKLPAIIRPSLTLGGTGGGVANTFEEFTEIVKMGLEASPINQVQIDQSLIGWKEYEVEVIRDKNDNTIIVCSVENIDPMGVHTGDSITCAPAMTLTDKEYQKMRNASIQIMRAIGVETGGSNVQFAVNPLNGDMVVIEMNPRVSRSSALVSKATGFPIARVAAKLAVGYTLDEIRNDIACAIPKEFDYGLFVDILSKSSPEYAGEDYFKKLELNWQKEDVSLKYQQVKGNRDLHLAKLKSQVDVIKSYINKEKEAGLTDFHLSQKVLPASFEPSIDYVVVKIPKFNFEKFGIENPLLGTQMQSVGEVMAIGRNFEEALQKAITSLEGVKRFYTEKPIKERLKIFSPTRIFDIFDALEAGFSVQDVCDLTLYDKWFVERIENIVRNKKNIQNLAGYGFEKLDKNSIFALKQLGFGDKEIRETLKIEAGEPGKHLFREYRKSLGVVPVYKKIDTCANEFGTRVNYFYSTYEKPVFKITNDGGLVQIAPSNESVASSRRKVIIIGSGPNRIGQGIEFDYTCVHGIIAAKEMGFESIMLNCNPETVSTDFDISDKLYFEPVTNEYVLNVVENEMNFALEGRVLGEKNAVFSTLYDLYLIAKSMNYKLSFEISGRAYVFNNKDSFVSGFLSQYIGVIIQFGGQTPLKLRETLKEYAIPIFGMTSDAIDICDDRGRFETLCKKLGINRPLNYYCETFAELEQKAADFKYNFIVRPSAVIGGRGMRIIQSKEEFESYIGYEGRVEKVLVDEFLTGAKEFDVDALRDKAGNIYICGVMEHIEYAGVHSGDSACSLPVRTICDETQKLIEQIVIAFANKLDVVGLINVQIAIKGEKIYVIEVNPRASRTVPFISKAVSLPIPKLATKVMLGKLLTELDEFQRFELKERIYYSLCDNIFRKHKKQDYWRLKRIPFYAVKEAMFSFEKFLASDIILGPEMKSTGEVMGVDETFEKAYAKALIATKQNFVTKGKVFVSVKNSDKTSDLLGICLLLSKIGFRIVSTKGTAKFLSENGIDVDVINKVYEGSDNVVDLIKKGDINLVINTTAGLKSIQDSFTIRRAILSKRVLHATTIEGAVCIVNAIYSLSNIISVL